MTFKEIFTEYFSQFRGQAGSIPTYDDREFLMGIQLGNSAIRKWDRVDGVLWNELYSRASDQNTTVFPTAQQTITSGTVSYDCPTNMRKPPREVFLYSGGDYQSLPVIDPDQLAGLSELSNAVTFIGGANIGYTMHITAALAEQYNGRKVDYLYYRKPTMLATDADPSDTVPDMSDPAFMIQHMLASRAAIARNGFLYNTASAEASQALVAMKIENYSGVPGKSDNLNMSSQWGVNKPVHDDINLSS